MVECFKPFLPHLTEFELVGEGTLGASIRDKLWLLGG